MPETEGRHLPRATAGNTPRQSGFGYPHPYRAPNIVRITQPQKRGMSASERAALPTKLTPASKHTPDEN